MPNRSSSTRRVLRFACCSAFAALGGCANGGELTEEELQALMQGVETGASNTTATGSTSGIVAAGGGTTVPSTPGTATGTTAGGGAGSVAPGAPPGTVVVPEMTQTGSTEIADAPEEPAGGSTTGSTATGSTATGSTATGSTATGSTATGSTATGTTPGFGDPPGGTAGGSGDVTPPAGACSDFSDAECQSLETFAVAWCVSLISCVNANCDPSQDDPLCFVPNYPEDPCVTIGYANGGLGKYADGGGNTNVAVDRAEEIIDAACGFN